MMLLLVNTSIYRHRMRCIKIGRIVYGFGLCFLFTHTIPKSNFNSLSACLYFSLSLSVSFIHPSSSFTIVKISFIASNNANNGNESMCPKNVTIHLYAGLLYDWKQSDSRAIIGRCNCSCNLWLYIKMNYVLLFFNMRCKSIFLWKFFSESEYSDSKYNCMFCRQLSFCMMNNMRKNNNNL